MKHSIRFNKNGSIRATGMFASQLFKAMTEPQVIVNPAPPEQPIPKAPPGPTVRDFVTPLNFDKPEGNK